MRHLPFVSTLLAVLLAAVGADAATDLVLRQRIVISSSTEIPREQMQYFTGPLRITDDERATTIVNLDKKTFTFINKTPPAPILIKKALGIQSGSSVPNKNKVGKLTKAQVEEIAKKKMTDLNAASLEAAMRTIEGTARSMGVEIA